MSPSSNMNFCKNIYELSVFYICQNSGILKNPYSNNFTQIIQKNVEKQFLSLKKTLK